jgi:hypothetical protein
MMRRRESRWNGRCETLCELEMNRTSREFEEYRIDGSRITEISSSTSEKQRTGRDLFTEQRLDSGHHH